MAEDATQMAETTVVQPRRGTQPVVTRFLSKHLWSAPPADTLGEAVDRQRASYNRAILLVRVFYGLSIYGVVSAIGTWPSNQRLTTASPLWPARWWFDWFQVSTSVNIIYIGWLAATLIVMLIPEQRLARFFYAFMLLQYMSFINGFSKINHDYHMWLFVAWVLILLPKGPWRKPRRISDRQYFLTVFWAAMFVMLFAYTLTGLWKIGVGTSALAHGRLSGFNLSGFSNIIGQNLLQTQPDTVLGKFFVRNEFAGWSLYTGTMYLETFSIIIAFRPRLHRIWGVGLITFHIGTQLAMAFTFGPNIMLLGLFFVGSPFAPDHIGFKETLLDLPVLHFISRRYQAVRRREHRVDAPAPELAPQS
jgi:hypothetical protein